jgi:carboxyl-terminal processing protease
MPFWRMTHRWLIPLLAFPFFVPPSASPQTDVPNDAVTQGSLKLARVYQLLDRDYMSPVDPDHAIFDGAIRGMLATLDPFSAFFDRSQFEMLQQQTRGEALGFGSILFVTPGKILVLETAQGSPSWRAGLGPGDEITAVNGVRIEQLGLDSLIHLLQKSKSHPVTLEVLHPGHVVSQQYELQPAEVALPTVDKAFMYEKDIGYIHLSSFESKTPQEMADALNRLGANNLNGLILDLRDNHGGMIQAALGVASLFLPAGKLVLTISGRALPEKSYRTIASSPVYRKPLIVLVNGETASAAEVVTAALQDHDRALIVGEPTFGKGVVESVMKLSDQTGLALLTAEYFTPSGRSIQRPLPGTALAHPELGRAVKDAAEGTANATHFRTDDGRTVTGGGGVTPEVTLPPETIDPWLSFLEQRGAFTSYASEYVNAHSKVAKTFEPDRNVMDDFKGYLHQQGIMTPAKYWKVDQNLLKTRIKTEVINLVFGLAMGNKVETRSDPQVRKAAALLPQVSRLLKGPAPQVAQRRGGS